MPTTAKPAPEGTGVSRLSQISGVHGAGGRVPRRVGAAVKGGGDALRLPSAYARLRVPQVRPQRRHRRRHAAPPPRIHSRRRRLQYTLSDLIVIEDVTVDCRWRINILFELQGRP